MLTTAQTSTVCCSSLLVALIYPLQCTCREYQTGVLPLHNKSLFVVISILIEYHVRTMHLNAVRHRPKLDFFNAGIHQDFFLLQISLEEILPDSFPIAFVSLCNFETLRLARLHKGGSWVICLGEISFHRQ